MNPITPDQLREWARLAEQATPGPWKVRQPRVKRSILSCDAEHLNWIITDDVRITPDAIFIAASREAVPALINQLEAQAQFVSGIERERAALCAEIERLTREKDTMRTALDGLKALRAVDPIMRDSLNAERDALREAAQQAREALSINDSVPDAESWAYYCPWCNAELGWAEHKAGAAMPHLPTCPRQLALAALDAALGAQSATASEPDDDTGSI